MVAYLWNRCGISRLALSPDVVAETEIVKEEREIC